MSTRLFAPDLPQEPLVRILQAVEQDDRLCSCALVCSTWATAARAATTDADISEGRLNTKSFESLTHWLQQYGQHLEALTVGPGTGFLPTMHLLQLHCSILTRLGALQLHDCTLKLQGGSNDASNGLLLPALHALSLRSVKFAETYRFEAFQLETIRDSLASLQMPNLTHLELSNAPYSNSQVGCYSFQHTIHILQYSTVMGDRVPPSPLASEPIGRKAHEGAQRAYLRTSLSPVCLPTSTGCVVLLDALSVSTGPG
jgi:hypothetical protein